MKRIEKTKLPKWIVSKLPFGSEDEVISSVLVPMVLFSLMGIGVLWHEFYDPDLVFVEVLLTIVLIAAIVGFLWRVIAQVDLLKNSREELMHRYKTTKDKQEKEKIKNKLHQLCVTVE